MNVREGNRAHHDKFRRGEIKGWRCHRPEGDDHGDWLEPCDARPHGLTWWKHHLWIKTHKYRHPLSWGVGVGYGMKTGADRRKLPWYVQLAYRLQGYPRSYWTNEGWDPEWKEKLIKSLEEMRNREGRVERPKEHEERDR